MLNHIQGSSCQVSMVRSSSGLAVDKAKVGTRQGGVEVVTPAPAAPGETSRV